MPGQGKPNLGKQTVGKPIAGKPTIGKLQAAGKGLSSEVITGPTGTNLNLVTSVENTHSSVVNESGNYEPYL